MKVIFWGFQQDNPPLHALEDVASGGNGVFLSGPGGFPVNSFLSGNFWVDVVFTANTVTDITPPTVALVSPADISTDIDLNTVISAVFNEALDPASVDFSTFELQDSNNEVVAATISYVGVTATLTPTEPLTASTTYTVIVKGGLGGVKDIAGNLQPSDRTWQFTTGDGSIVVFNANFDNDSNGFVYIDDGFRSTTEPDYAAGARINTGGFSGGGLQVVAGGLDDVSIFGMSGAWEQNFVLDEPSEITVSLRYKLTQTPHYEGDEQSQVLLSIDGNLIGEGLSDFIAEI